jgi:anti-sigma factor RsiW
MQPTDRTVAGLTCAEVLADLSHYLDDDLSAERARQIEAHVSACPACAAFGRAFGDIVEAVRVSLREPEAVPDDIVARLKAALGS